MNFLSIDPGKTGAIVAWVNGVPDAWHQFDEKERFFGYDTIRTIEGFYEHHDMNQIVIEALMDRRIYGQSSIANNTTAVNWGVHYGMAQWYGCDIDIVHASAWKSRMDMDKDKDKSLDLARNLFPMCESALKLKKNHDMAEALLIGQDYLERNTNG